jgi:broad specificity phosphatase PhoE
MGRLILIRHCETNANVEGTVQGRRDLSLSKRGERQAELVGKFVRENFSVGKVVSSVRKRCIQTAEALGHSVETTPLLREIDWGDWEGKKWSDLKADYPEDVEALLTADPNFSTPNGDSLMSFAQRIDEAITEIRFEEDSEDTAVVTHEGTVRTMIPRLLDWPPSHMSNLVAFPGSISIVSMAQKTPKLELLNFYQHLSATYENQG